MPLASTHPTSAEPRTPLYRQIADAIRGQIADGTLAPGAPLPSEQSLMQQFGVSRGTIRQARAALRASGVIGGSQGRTFSVLGDSLTQPFDEFVSVTSWLRSIGKTPGAIVLCQDKGLAGDEAAAHLGIAPTDLVWRIRRLRTADGEPLMIEHTVMPEAVGDLLAGADLEHTSMYASLADRGVVVASARHRIDAVAATADEARLLHVRKGSPLLRLRRDAHDVRGNPVEWAEDRYRGDRTDVSIENNATASGVVRKYSEGRA